jgi:hypothetical protein
LLAAIPSSALADDSPINDVGREHRATSGAGLTIGAGAATALRSMSFAGSNGSIDHVPNPFLGGIVDLALDLYYFESAEAGLRLEATGFYGTATAAEPDPILGRPLVAETSELTSVVTITRALRASWDLRLGAGMEWSARRLEDNDVYTGHTYLALRFDAGADWWNGDDSMHAWGIVQLLPALSVDQSNGQYGRASAFGGRLVFGWGWFFYQPTARDLAGSAELIVRARAARFRAQFPSGGIVGERASSDDDTLDLVVALRYHL